jgi:hypothetical protein
MTVSADISVAFQIIGQDFLSCLRQRFAIRFKYGRALLLGKICVFVNHIGRWVDW